MTCGSGTQNKSIQKLHNISKKPFHKLCTNFQIKTILVTRGRHFGAESIFSRRRTNAHPQTLAVIFNGLGENNF
jgi:hypothetical protein